MNLKRRSEPQPQPGTIDADMMQRIMEMHTENEKIYDELTKLQEANKKLYEEIVGLRRENKELLTLVSDLHNYLGRMALHQHASNRKAIQLRPEGLVRIFLSFFHDFRQQIPTGVFGVFLRHTRDMTRRGHHVQHHNFKLEMPGQRGSLMNHAQRGIRVINRQKNLLDVRHGTPAREQIDRAWIISLSAANPKLNDCVVEATCPSL